MSFFSLSVEPPKKPIIHDANGRKMTSTLGPYKVGEDLVATCVTSAGMYSTCKLEMNVGNVFLSLTFATVERFFNVKNVKKIFNFMRFTS